MIKFYNIYITEGDLESGFEGANGRHAQSTHRSHLWINNGEINKNHIDSKIAFDVDEVVSKFGIGLHENVLFEDIDMSEVYKDIQRINKLDPATTELRLCKFFEEAGEFSRAINMKLGRKVTDLTPEEILEEIKEEAADTIQCLVSFADTYELEYSHFKDEFIDDSHSPDGTSPEVMLIKMNKYVGGICYRFEKNHPELIYQFNRCISKVLGLTSYYGIKESDVVVKIAQKNKKWERVAEKRAKNG